MAATKELSIDEKLQQLWELQQIDSKIDKIQILKGELPIEVKEDPLVLTLSSSTFSFNKYWQ